MLQFFGTAFVNLTVFDMAKWKTLKDQVLAGTLVDLQGERNTKEFLVSLCQAFASKERVPLNQHHDMSLEPVGYINNFRVVPADAEEKEWKLVGDVYFHDVDIDEALKGFSYSMIEDMHGNCADRQLGVYVPFPFYNDKSLLGALTAVESGIVAGAWRKKAADPDTVSLIISFILFLAAPAYTDYWNKKVSPLLAQLRSRLGDRHSIQYVQTNQGPKGEIFGIYFIPPPGKEDEFLTLAFVMEGIRTVERYVATDDLAAKKGVHLVKMVFLNERNAYGLQSVEYQDGSVVKHSVD